jgi:hypothetical protein
MARMLALLGAAALLAAWAMPSQAFIGKKDWNKVDWDKAEEDLKADDDPELLLDDDALTAKEFEKRRNRPLSPPEDASFK